MHPGGRFIWTSSDNTPCKNAFFTSNYYSDQSRFVTTDNRTRTVLILAIGANVCIINPIGLSVPFCHQFCLEAFNCAINFVFDSVETSWMATGIQLVSFLMEGQQDPMFHFFVEISSPRS